MSPSEDIDVRELYILAFKRQESEWNHTSSLLAKIHNLVAKTPVDVEQLHPMKVRSRAPKRSGLSTDEFAEILDSMEG